MERKNNNQEEPPVVVRAKLPRGDEVLGIIEQRLGGNKMMINCSDKVLRNCRVPGRLKRKLWLRPNDVVIVKPWEFDKTKADVIFKYSPAEIQWLNEKGFLNQEKEEF
ncbi:MAG: translation initiation factor eIF-1A [archaeon]|nr:translation initiation factor eIF-1A [archaeon]